MTVIALHRCQVCGEPGRRIDTTWPNGDQAFRGTACPVCVANTLALQLRLGPVYVAMCRAGISDEIALSTVADLVERLTRSGELVGFVSA